MADQVEEVKRKTDIVAVVGERVKLVKSGRNFKGLCPFHSEKTPSFFVSPEMGIYRCFGCGKGGDVISFLEEFEGMEFPEALEYLAERVGVRLERKRREGRQRGIRERLVEINHLAGEFYHFLLTDHQVGEEARLYLKRRGVSQEAIRVFKLGYAPKSWDGLQKFLIGKKGYKAEELEQAGLIIKSEKRRGQSTKDHFYDRFRGRLMFPLTNVRGRVMGFAGRVLDPKVKEAKYVNTPETQLYHKSELLYGLSVSKAEIKQRDFAVVVEGELDAISSWQAKVKNVVAIKGSAFTQEQIKRLQRYTRNVRLALDADAAGEEATRRSISLADELGMNVRVVRIAGGKDPDEIAQSDAKAWRELVKQAVNVYDFYLESVFSKFDLRTGEGKRRAMAELAPVLAGISNQVEQAHYIKRAAEKLRVAEEAVIGEVRKAGKRQEYKAGEERRIEGEEGGKNRRERLEEYWLGLVLRVGEKVRRESVEKVKRVLGVGGVAKVAGVLEKIKGGVKPDELMELLPAELKRVVEQVWLMEDEPEDRMEVEAELERVERELERLKLQEKMRSLRGEIEALEKKRRKSKAEVEKLKELRQEFVIVSRGLGSLRV